jgi:hypothetical protein
MNDDHFRVEESAALRHVIFPSYPELHDIKLAPQVGPFLSTLRAGDGAKWTQVY